MIALKNTTNNQIFYIIHRKMDGEQGWDLMPLNVEYTENGQYSVVPPSGFDGFSSVNVTVDVEQTPCKLTTSTVNITEEGEHTITPPSGYDGLSEVVVNVDVDCGTDCETCYDEGVADQKAKLTSTTFTENGNYTREDGWNAVQVNVDTVTPYNNGVADQKAKLTSLNVTQNGTYRREDGYNEVVVNVPSSDNCQECYEQGEADQKARLTSATFVNNGHYTLADGWNDVTVNVDTVTPYNNGYNDGVNDQLNRLAPLYVTQNGTYSRPDGYSTVEVDVDCGAYVDVLELDKHQIDVISSDDEFPFNEGLTYQVTLYSSCPWEITGTPYWVSVDQIAGSAGMFIINITVTNFMDNDSGYITFENECGLTDQILINEIDYKMQPLTFKVTHSGCLYWKQYGIAYSRPLDILNSNGQVVKTIHSIQENNGCLVECLDAGDVVRFRSQPADQQDPSTYSYFVFTNGLEVEVYGNLNDFCNPSSSYRGTYGCYHLFAGGGVTSAEHLYIPEVSAYYCDGLFMDNIHLRTAPKILPAMKLSNYCYAGMFSGCISLVNAPQLPAMWLSPYCYAGMFQSCDSLVNAPALPSTLGLSTHCYDNMFRSCSSLRESPYLGAGNLQSQNAQGCYEGMFMSCTNLEKISTNMTTQPSTQYTSSWVYDVAPNGTFVKNPNATWTNSFGNNAIPQGWTVVSATA